LKLLACVGYAATGSSLGSLKRSPRTIMAQAMRAILLANSRQIIAMQDNVGVSFW
jgi:hypothetical protein